MVKEGRKEAGGGAISGWLLSMVMEASIEDRKRRRIQGRGGELSWRSSGAKRGKAGRRSGGEVVLVNRFPSLGWRARALASLQSVPVQKPGTTRPIVLHPSGPIWLWMMGDESSAFGGAETSLFLV